jgi:EF hand
MYTHNTVRHRQTDTDTDTETQRQTQRQTHRSMQVVSTTHSSSVSTDPHPLPNGIRSMSSEDSSSVRKIAQQKLREKHKQSTGVEPWVVTPTTALQWKLQRIFAELDQNGDGKLCRDELRDALVRLGVSSKDKINSSNKDGTVSISPRVCMCVFVFVFVIITVYIFCISPTPFFFCIKHTTCFSSITHNRTQLQK